MPTLLLVSFVAGVLTVAAPCVLPLLPVIVGGSIVRTDASSEVAQRQWFRPLVIAASLAVSVIVFTLLLKATTSLLGVPQQVWQILAGTIVVAFGLTLLFPQAWERIMTATGLQRRANEAMDRSYRRGGIAGDILLGASLGPTFSSCSPTYALIIATVLPASFAEGLLYIVAYAVGLAGALLLVAFLGQAFARKLGWLSAPRGWFRVTIGVLMVVVGLAVALGIDKVVQAFVIEQGWYDPIAHLEEGLTG
ncbi:cytochrome c biogenesis protein CcdA [Leifsonia sp. AK011]|uniref:cytochrome c biogenesis CcdA family protein n=1 Tax=Leifsonia sp. AK011 TaxID=2723075 RepID=UPI0015C80F1B|nr:cytochrome c biogenesis protein CcdA [Leifsonia sp. AK011]NYF11421.1 cytochrome c biogenesis protein CcdA [Leifsonia sp. AK011]